MNEFPLDKDNVSMFLDSNPAFLKQYIAEQNIASLNQSAQAQKTDQLSETDDHYLDENIIDVTGKIAQQAREEARILSRKNLSLIDLAEDNTKRWQRLHNATIGFIRCQNLLEFSEMLDETLPVIFGVAGARLLMPQENAISDAETYGFLVLPEAEISTICRAQSVYLGPPPKSGLALFSAPIASIAVVTLPDNLPAPIAGSALLLAGRNKNSFAPNQADTILSNLSEIIGTCLLMLLKLDAKE